MGGVAKRSHGLKGGFQIGHNWLQRGRGSKFSNDWPCGIWIGCPLSDDEGQRVGQNSHKFDDLFYERPQGTKSL